MKFYCLKLDNLYLAGNSRHKHFVKDIEKCRKFNRKSDAANCRNTSYYSDLIKNCEVIEIDVFGFTEIDSKGWYFQVMDYSKISKEL